MPPLDQNTRRAIGLTKHNPENSATHHARLRRTQRHHQPYRSRRTCPCSQHLAHGKQRPAPQKSLAREGEDLGTNGRLCGIVTLRLHATGQPLAQRAYNGKKDEYANIAPLRDGPTIPEEIKRREDRITKLNETK